MQGSLNIESLAKLIASSFSQDELFNLMVSWSSGLPWYKVPEPISGISSYDYSCKVLFTLRRHRLLDSAIIRFAEERPHRQDEFAIFVQPKNHTLAQPQGVSLYFQSSIDFLGRFPDALVSVSSAINSAQRSIQALVPIVALAGASRKVVSEMYLESLEHAARSGLSVRIWVPLQIEDIVRKELERKSGTDLPHSISKNDLLTFERRARKRLLNAGALVFDIDLQQAPAAAPLGDTWLNPDIRKELVLALMPHYVWLIDAELPGQIGIFAWSEPHNGQRRTELPFFSSRSPKLISEFDSQISRWKTISTPSLQT